MRRCENLRIELETRPQGGPEGREQAGKPRGHVARERHQPLGQICNGGKRFGILGRDMGRDSAAVSACVHVSHGEERTRTHVPKSLRKRTFRVRDARAVVE